MGQEAVWDKANEITAIPLLLELLALNGALATIDAMGTQHQIAQIILERGRSDLLALKANRPAIFKDVQVFFADPPQGLPDGHETIDHEIVDGDHGRINIHRHRVCHDVAWLFSKRRYPDEPNFPGLAMIAMVEAETQRDGKTTRTRRYYLSSDKLDAETFAHAVRCHWHIENRLN